MKSHNSFRFPAKAHLLSPSFLQRPRPSLSSSCQWRPSSQLRASELGSPTLKFSKLFDPSYAASEAIVVCLACRFFGATELPSLSSSSLMGDEKNAFYVVRKGDVIGIYRNFSDCQDQAGSSVSSPSVSVYKGYYLPKDTEDYLKSQGLKNALYTINAADMKDDIFGQLIPCPIQQPSTSGGMPLKKQSPPKRTLEMLQLDSYQQAVTVASVPTSSQRKHLKVDNVVAAQTTNCMNLVQASCTLEFDGASKGNPGLAGAGAVLRAENGTKVYRLREGVGIATNNVAEYRALILGLRYALQRGFKNIRVQGDSKLVCMQIQGLWKIKNQNMADLCKVAKELKEKFASFEINHVLREYNSEADVQANLALNLRDGQIEVVCDQR